MKIKITYMSGAGNLFTVIDNSETKFSDTELQNLSKIFCNINEMNSFRTEGFMAIEPSSEFDFQVKYFNPDSSSGMMCGNGGRAAVRFAALSNLSSSNSSLQIFTMSGKIYKAEIKSNTIRLEMPPANSFTLNEYLQLNDQKVKFNFVDVATEHCVIDYYENFTGDFDNFDIQSLGSKIRNHDKFSPKGANANFYRINDDNSVSLRTYERGVEAETGACGTGAVSTAIVVNLINGIDFPIKIIPTSGSVLIIDSIRPTDVLKNTLILEGEAIVLEEKIVEINREEL